MNEGDVQVMRELDGGPDPLAYWTPGHVDKEAFAAAVMEYCATLKGEWRDRFQYKAQHVEHVYYRNVPLGKDFPGEMMMLQCSGPARGAYPVTQIDIDRACGDYRYESSYPAWQKDGGHYEMFH